MLQKKLIINNNNSNIIKSTTTDISPVALVGSNSINNSSISSSSYQSIISTPHSTNKNTTTTTTDYLSFSPISDLTEMSSETSSLNSGGISSANTTPLHSTTPNNHHPIDGADFNARKLKETTTTTTNNNSSSSTTTPTTTTPTQPLTASQEESNWQSLNSKMKAFSKYDSKRGSVLIEHLSEFNKLASSQIILGEEVEKEQSPNLSEREVVPIITTPIANNNTTVNNNNNSNNNNNQNSNTLDNIVLQGINLFNDKPKKGIEYFIQNKLLEKKPEAVAEFLHKCPLLNKRSIGDYLGDMDEFCIKTLESLIARFNFQDLDFDMALRQLLYCFLLPGEAQKIDRIVQKFANHFYKENLKAGIFEDPDAVYMLAFALILLNTDVHNPQIKHKMSKNKFSRSLNGINSGKNLPLEYIEDIYDRILVDEIKMEPTATLFPYACKKGWLNIRVKGRVTDKWSRKWCILSDGTLYFFRKPTDTNPIRYLHPDTVITPQKEMKGRKNCFILNHSSPPISLQSLMMRDAAAKQQLFNPQAIFQMLAQFGKEKKHEHRFWDSVSEKYHDQKQFDISLFNDSFDTDSVGSFDTLSESSNYYDDDTSSSVNSTSPIGSMAMYDKKQTAFSLRLGNKKSKDQLQEFENDFHSSNGSNNSEHNTPTTTMSTPNKPPVPAKSYPTTTTTTTTTTPTTPNNNNSLTQPRPPTFMKQGTSLIRSSSISTFSTPNSPSNITTANSIQKKPSTPSSTNSNSSSSTSTPTTLTAEQQQNKKSIEDIMKLQEKLIKSSKQQSTVILNADSKREMDSWIRLILSQFKNK